MQNWPCSLVFDLVTHRDLVKNDPMSVQTSEFRSCVKSRGGRPGLPVPNKPDCFCGCKAALNRNLPGFFVLYGQNPTWLFCSVTLNAACHDLAH